MIRPGNLIAARVPVSLRRRSLAVASMFDGFDDALSRIVHARTPCLVLWSARNPITIVGSRTYDEYLLLTPDGGLGYTVQTCFEIIAG